MTNEFGPETKRLCDELVCVLRSALCEGDADDAIGCLDALLSADRDDNLTEAANLVADVRDQQYRSLEFKAERHALNRAHAALLAARSGVS